MPVLFEGFEYSDGGGGFEGWGVLGGVGGIEGVRA